MRSLVVGRFQVPHLGHVKLIRQALEAGPDLAIAIGSTQAKPSTRNPLTFDERKQLLEAALPDVFGPGGPGRIYNVPDLNDPVRWVAHCLAITGPVDHVFGNDDGTLALFEQAHITVMRPGLEHRESLEGSAIRRLMVEDDPTWQKSVPKAVAKLLIEWKIPQRLRLLA